MWCSGRWCQVWQGGGFLVLSLKMSQNSFDDVLIFDASDNRYRPPAASAARRCKGLHILPTENLENRKC